MGIMGLVATVIGVSVYESIFRPAGAKKIAMQLSALSTHAQGWAVESGNITIMEVDLSLGSYIFYFFDENGKKIPLPSKIFENRTLPPRVKFLSAEIVGHEIEEGKIQIPYFSEGYSNEALLTFEDSATGEIWTVHFKKFYGDTRIHRGKMTMSELAVEEE